ncbi:alpha/beta hydrolase [Pseudoxanthomonas wuyuanensis]
MQELRLTLNQRLSLSAVAGLMALALVLPPCHAAAGDGEAHDGERIYLWPGRTAPDSAGLPLRQQVTERSEDPARPDRAMTGVTQPYLVVYRPSKPNGIGLLVTPGGGYQRIVLDKEGTALVPDFADTGGVTLFVLRYRLPGDGHASAANAPLADAQRALRLIRTRARKWQLDPQRIGVMGFSAGGHVAASLGTRFEEKVYETVDAADALSARPDFMLLIYPVISMDSAIAHSGSRARLLGAAPTPERVRLYSAEQRVWAKTPATFLLHAEDDGVVSSANSLRMHAALRAASVPVEMHLYSQGGHGFGVRETAGLPVALWPQLALRWMQSIAGNLPTPVPEN